MTVHVMQKKKSNEYLAFIQLSYCLTPQQFWNEFRSLGLVYPRGRATDRADGTGKLTWKRRQYGNSPKAIEVSNQSQALVTIWDG